MTTAQNFPTCVQFLNDGVSEETIGVQIQVADVTKLETILAALKNTPFDSVEIYPNRKKTDLSSAFSIKVLSQKECLMYIERCLEQDGYGISDNETMGDLFDFYADEYGIYHDIVDGELAEFVGIKITTPWREDSDNFVLFAEFTNQSKYGSIFEASCGTLLKDLMA